MLTRALALSCAAALLAGCVSAPGPGGQPRQRAAGGTATLLFTGDVLLDRGVADALARRPAAELLRDTRKVLGTGDVACCNLEFPFVSEPARIPKPIAFAVPPGRAALLRQAGFTLACLANNHTMDCGKAGLTETMKTLAKNGIAFFGAGKDEARAHEPRILTTRGVRVAFLGYSDFSPEGIIRLPDSPTVAVLREEAPADEIRRARSRANILVVSFHWGREFYPLPTARQRRIAREAVDAGADIVIGHHPHVLQPVEMGTSPSGRTSVIAYSLGNFIFDTTRENSAETMVLECRVTRAGVLGVKSRPMRMEECFPRLRE